MEKERLKRKYNTEDGVLVKLTYRINRRKGITPLIDGYSFTLNRANQISGAKYYKCVTAGCKARLTIYPSNDSEGKYLHFNYFEWNIKTFFTGRLVSEHNHQNLLAAMEIRLNGQTHNKEQFINSPALDTGDDPLDIGTDKPLPLPRKFNDTIKNGCILTKKEKAIFRQMAKSNTENVNNCKNSIEVRQSEKYGYGVFCKEDIGRGSLLGCYGGTLVRALGDDAVYSFNVKVSSEPLFVDAETLDDRSMLR